MTANYFRKVSIEIFNEERERERERASERGRKRDVYYFYESGCCIIGAGNGIAP